MGELFGTPAHPLLVHIPVVVLPLLAIAAIALAARPAWRQRVGWLLAGVTLITAAITVLATKSGERLHDALQPSLGSLADDHMQLGNQTALLAVIFFVATAAMFAIDRWYLPRTNPKRWPTAFAVGVALLGVLATVWAIRTGHEGARITWEGIDVP